MRVMVIVKATKDSEAGTMPGPELLAAMGAFNEELARAGEAIRWAKRCPSPSPGIDTHLEIRPVFEESDFA